MWIVCPNLNCTSRTKVFTTTRGWHNHLSRSMICSDIHDRMQRERNPPSIQRPPSRPAITTDRTSTYSSRIAGHYLYEQLPESLTQTSVMVESGHLSAHNSSNMQSDVVLTELDNYSDNNNDGNLGDGFIGVDEEYVIDTPIKPSPRLPSLLLSE